AAAAYTDNDDLCEFFKVIIHFEHSLSLHIVSLSSQSVDRQQFPRLFYHETRYITIAQENF
ncbi:hypothetical protein, partial [Selenomonas noxia]|uniref:hypothetical protein n=1 Tax=Selenomonas noxia TaxID=135083 RepID=UPI0028E5C31F